MKQFIRILAGVLVILMMITVAMGCKKDEEPTDIETTESTEETETSDSKKKPYIAPVIEPDDDDPEEEKKPEIPEVTGPLSVETDDNTDFSGAADMH